MHDTKQKLHKQAAAQPRKNIEVVVKQATDVGLFMLSCPGAGLQSAPSAVDAPPPWQGTCSLGQPRSLTLYFDSPAMTCVCQDCPSSPVSPCGVLGGGRPLHTFCLTVWLEDEWQCGKGWARVAHGR